MEPCAAPSPASSVVTSKDSRATSTCTVTSSVTDGSTSPSAPESDSSSVPFTSTRSTCQPGRSFHPTVALSPQSTSPAPENATASPSLAVQRT